MTIQSQRFLSNNAKNFIIITSTTRLAFNLSSCDVNIINIVKIMAVIELIICNESKWLPTVDSKCQSQLYRGC